MDTLVLEGTVEEVQKRLGELRLQPTTHVRLTLEEVGTLLAGGTRNGVALIPQRHPGVIVTSELVADLLDAE
jgi:hypothetical protein